MADPKHSERRLSKRYAWIALAMAGIAGAVDGTGYLFLAHVFTSHMSGNTVAMMLHVASGNWREAWRHFQPIVIFFCGVLIGLTLTDVLVAMRIARMFAIIAGVESMLLVIFLIVAHPPQQWMVVWLAGAMGIQNAMLRRVGEHRVRTTFITGMLSNAAQGLVETVQALIQRSGEAGAKFADFTFYGGIWVCFAVGGTIAALLAIEHGTVALLLPIGALLVLIAYDAISPLTNVPLEEASAG